MDMTKEELVELIKSTVTSLNQSKVAVNQEGKESCNEKATCETPDENATEVETTEVEEEKKEATDDATEEKTEVTEEVAEEKNEVEDEDEDETTEVVKEEVLNTAPATTVPVVEEEWKKLNGEDFRKWCAEHATYCNSYKG